MSTSPEDRRRTYRLSVGPDHQVRFRAGEQAYLGIPLSDISAGGCCARIPVQQAEALEKGMDLQGLHLAHPRLPGVPLLGRVAWIMGRHAGKTEGFVVVGIEFVDPNPTVYQAIENYVKEALGERSTN